MAEMNQREKDALKHFCHAYKIQWDLNQYYRTRYDENLEYYRGWRNPEKYPLAYNMSFNKLLPRVFTILSRFMDQLYQGGSGNLVSVRPRKRGDVQRAPRVEGLLNYQLEQLNECDQQGGSYLHNFTWLFNALVFGKGITKMYWKKEERITPSRLQIPIPRFNEQNQVIGYDTKSVIMDKNQVVYDGPYAEVLHNKMFVPHPHFKSIQKMPQVFCIYKRSLDYIKQKMDAGTWERRALKDLALSEGSKNAAAGLTAGKPGEDTFEGIIKSLQMDNALTERQLRTERATPHIDILEGYGRYIWPEDDAPYEVGRGYKIKGKESETTIHIGNYMTVLGMEKNKSGIRPLFDIPCYLNPELYWDMGIIDLGKDIQEQYNNLGNLRFQNVMMLVNQMLLVNQNADIDPDYLVWKPYGLVPVDDPTDVQPLVTPDAFQSGAFREQEQFFEDVLSDMTGMYPYNLGQQPPRQEYVGTMYSLQSMGEARTRLLLMTMDHTGFRPFLKYMMYLNMLYLDPQREARINGPMGDQFIPLFAGDLHVDYDFSARYTAMEPALGKQFRAQQLIQYSQMWMGSPFLQQYQFMKAIMELMDFHDTDRYLKTPEQVMREQQMMMQQAARTQMMGAAIQDQLAERQSNRKMLDTTIKQMLK